MHIIRKFYTIIDTLLKTILVVATVGIIVCASLQIFSRELLTHTWTWTEEMSRFCLTWMTLLAAALGTRYKTHIRIVFVRDLVPEFAKRLLDILGIICTYVFGFALLIYGCQLCELTAKAVSPSLKAPMPVVYLIFPISSIFMILFNIEDTIKLFAKDKYMVEEDE